MVLPGKDLLLIKAIGVKCTPSAERCNSKPLLFCSAIVVHFNVLTSYFFWPEKLLITALEMFAGVKR